MNYLRPIYLVCLILLPVIACAQSYTPFPNRLAIWSELRQVGNTGIPGTNIYLNYNYKLFGDTSINGQTYKIIEFRYYWHATVNVVTGETSIVYRNLEFEKIGALREEDKKIYFYDFGLVDGNTENAFNHLKPNTENLIYDFNIEVGDTLHWKPYEWNDYSVLQKVDAIELLNGEKRKRYHFGYDNVIKESWIQGIGSSHGLLGTYNNIYPVYSTPSRHCFNDNYEVLVNDRIALLEAPVCRNLISNVAEKRLATALKIFPNPFDEQLRISIDNPKYQDAEIRLLTISGQQLDRFPANNQVELITGDLNAGIYLLQIYTREGVLLHNEKIVKF